MSDPLARDDGYDDLLDAIQDGEGYYLQCANGHGSLPPRRVCPVCGSTDLAETPLAETGVVETFTVVHVSTPAFVDDAPYATAIADFDGVRVTGQLRGIDPEAVETGLIVSPDVAESATTGERVLVFDAR